MIPDDSNKNADKRAWMLAILVAICTFAAVAPPLTWPEFTGGNENIVVQTALEMRHGGSTLVPQMMGEPRVKKPPLVAWITAASIGQETIDRLELSHGRDEAYRDLAWQVRWTGLLAGCVLILATFELGRVLFDSRIGLLAAIVVATNILFQKYMRQSTSDVHLGLWVTIANVAFAHGVMRGRIWIAAIVGMMAAGIAFLCKGPVALVETVVPFIAVLWLRRGPLTLALSRGERGQLSPFLLGAALFASVALPVFVATALPWFIYVYLTVPDVMTTWFSEVSRHGATDLEPSNPAMYALLFPLMWPWVVMMAGGVVVMWRERSRGDLIASALVIIPLAIMIWFPDRKERYLLPMIAPAAIICARGLSGFLSAPKKDRSTLLVTIIHYAVLAMVCIGFPLAAISHPAIRTAANEPWYTPSMAGWIAVMFGALILLGAFLQRRSRWSLPITTFIAMLILQAVVMYGYRWSESGISPMKPLADYIRIAAPGAVVYDWNANGRRVDEDLPIYLNRTVLQIDPKTLSPSDRHQIYVTRQSSEDIRNDVKPVPPPGWMFLLKVKERKNVWWAFILPPAGTGSP